MKHSIFILSHQDDEICVFENIRLAIDQLGADLNIRQKVAKENTYKIRTINMLKEIDFLN